MTAESGIVQLTRDTYQVLLNKVLRFDKADDQAEWARIILRSKSHGWMDKYFALPPDTECRQFEDYRARGYPVFGRRSPLCINSVPLHLWLLAFASIFFQSLRTQAHTSRSRTCCWRTLLFCLWHLPSWLYAQNKRHYWLSLTENQFLVHRKPGKAVPVENCCFWSRAVCRYWLV